MHLQGIRTVQDTIVTYSRLSCEGHGPNFSFTVLQEQCKQLPSVGVLVENAAVPRRCSQFLTEGTCSVGLCPIQTVPYKQS